MWKLLLPFLFLLVLVGATVLADKPRPAADFRFINRGDISTLDVTQMSWMQDLRIARVLWEGLVRNDVFSWEYRAMPGMAERWERGEGDRVWTFYLRDGLKWSDGSPLTAEDFLYSWRRVLLPETLCDYVKMLSDVKGADEFFAWRAEATRAFAADRTIVDRPAAAATLWEETKAKFTQMVRLSAPDARTLRIELERPVPHFLDIAAFPVLYPLKKDLLDRYTTINADTGLVQVDPAWTKAGALVTNGPLKLVSWRFKRDMRLEANEHYWNAKDLAIRSIEIPSVDDGNAQVLAFKTGAVDWVSDVTPHYRGDMIEAKQRYYQEHATEYAKLKAMGLDPIEIDRRLPPDPRQNIHAFPAFGVYFLNVNCQPNLPGGRPNPLADPRVRRALAMSIDKEAVSRNVRRLGEPVSHTLIPVDSIAGYASPQGLSFDPEAARKLLAEAGYPDGKGMIALEYLFNKEGGHDMIAQAVARDWQKHLNIKVLLQQKEIKVFRDDLRAGNFMISRGSWFGDYGSPPTFLDINKTGDGNNDRKYSNPVFDELLNRAADESDPAARMELYTRAERILVEEDLPLLPIFRYNQVYLFDAHKFTGISSHPRSEQAMFRVDVFGDGLGSDEPRMLPPRKPEQGALRVPARSEGI